MHNFQGSILDLKYLLIEPVPIFYDSKGFQISFKDLLQAALENQVFLEKLNRISSIKASSNIDLGSQIYQGSFTVTCRTCGSLLLETNNNSYKFIPSFSLGWHQKINQKFSFSISAGIQYFDMPNIISKTSRGEENLPPYVMSKINSIIENSNQELDKYGEIIPTISISTNYIF